MNFKSVIQSFLDILSEENTIVDFRPIEGVNMSTISRNFVILCQRDWHLITPKNYVILIIISCSTVFIIMVDFQQFFIA